MGCELSSISSSKRMVYLCSDGVYMPGQTLWSVGGYESH